MRSYGQYCGLAKALDVVGDRWTLLIVRELMLLGPARYTDLRNGLPGVATNLLADRLRELEDAGVVEREEAPPPVATTLFRLTPRGAALENAIRALGAWGSPLLGDWKKGEEFRSYWLTYPLRMALVDNAPREAGVTIEIRSGDEGPVVVEAAHGRIATRLGKAEDPDAVVAGDPHLVIGLLTGRLTLGAARAKGLRFSGDASVLARVRPGS